MPICQNPTGITLSKKQRCNLEKIANLYENFYILANETNHFLTWNEKSLYSLSNYHPNFISLCSFNKLLAPSIKLGWIYMDLDVIKFKKSNEINMLNSLIVDYAITTKFIDNYLTKIINLLKDRYIILSTELKKYFEFNEPVGGFNIWIKSKINSNDILEKIIESNIKYKHGNLFSSKKTKKDLDKYFRLCFTYYNNDELILGAKRLINFYCDYNKIKISIIGYNGLLGKQIIEKIKLSKKYKFINGISRDISLNKMTDVIIDVSSPEGTKNLINYLIKNNIRKPLLIGTRGHTNYTLIKIYSKIAPVMLISNFSEGMQLITSFYKQLNKLSNIWNFKINELYKISSNVETIKSLSSQIKRDFEIKFIEKEDNGYIIKCTNKTEEITISYIIKNKDIYTEGCLKYIDDIIKMDNGLITDVKLKDNIIIKIYTSNGDNILIVENYKDDKKKFINEQITLRKDLNSIIFITEIKDNLINEWEFHNINNSHINFRCLLKYMKDLYNYDNIKIYYNKSFIIGKIENNNYIIEMPMPSIGNQISYNMQCNISKELEPLGINILDIENHIILNSNLIIEIKQNIFELDENILIIAYALIYEYYKNNIQNEKIIISFININSDNDMFHQINIISWDSYINKIMLNCNQSTLASYLYYLNDSTINTHFNNVIFIFKNNTQIKIFKNQINNQYYLSGNIKDYILNKETEENQIII